MFKRIVLFALTNIAVLFALAIVLRLLGLDRIPIGANGEIPYQQLLAWAAVYGFTGSFISLLLSKPMAKWSTGARVIDSPSNETEAWLLRTVETLARKASISPPQVGIYDAPDANAFATGAFRNSAFVAVSTGLVRSMSRQEVEAVLAHEVAHVANGDMVTMTLLQGVMNTFVLFLSRIIGFAVDAALSRRDSEGEGRRGSGMASYVVSMIAQLVLGLVASLILAWFSRQREYRADAGSAAMNGSGPMIAALASLQRSHEGASALPGSLQAFGIRGGALSFFSSHPPIEARIEALQRGTYAVGPAGVQVVR